MVSAWGGPCVKCGHPASYHGATFCKVQAGAAVKRDCDCHGYADVERLRCDHCGEVGCDWIGDISRARAEAAEAEVRELRAALALQAESVEAAETREREARGVASELIDKLSVEHVRANEAARLSADARDKADDAERRWADHQDVCVMASADRETLEVERDAARAARADLVADLRAAEGEWHEAWSSVALDDNEEPVLRQVALAWLSARGIVCAILDRHAGESS